MAPSRGILSAAPSATTTAAPYHSTSHCCSSRGPPDEASPPPPCSLYLFRLPSPLLLLLPSPLLLLLLPLVPFISSSRSLLALLALFLQHLFSARTPRSANFSRREAIDHISNWIPDDFNATGDLENGERVRLRRDSYLQRGRARARACEREVGDGGKLLYPSFLPSFLPPLVARLQSSIFPPRRFIRTAPTHTGTRAHSKIQRSSALYCPRLAAAGYLEIVWRGRLVSAPLTELSRFFLLLLRLLGWRLCSSSARPRTHNRWSFNHRLRVTVRRVWEG